MQGLFTAGSIFMDFVLKRFGPVSYFGSSF